MTDELEPRRGPRITISAGDVAIIERMPTPAPEAKLGRKALREFLAQRQRRRFRIVQGGK